MRYRAMIVLRRLVSFVLIWFAAQPMARAAVSNVIVSSRDAVSLVAASETATKSAITLGLRFRLAPGWHIYWSDPGDAGEPPDIAITAPAGAKSGPFSYPAPQLLISGGLGDYVETGDVLLPFTATLPAGNVAAIAASAHWLVCDPSICVPEHGTFRLALSGAAGPSSQAPLFARAARQIPRPSPFRTVIAPHGTLAMIGAGLTPEAVTSARFFPDDPAALINAAPQKLGFVEGGFNLALKLASAKPRTAPLSGVIEITDRSGQSQALRVTAQPGTVPPAIRVTPWLVWIGAALLGGLILNLMPCVFPVLAIKAMAVARLGRQDRARVRGEALAYTAGAIAAMLLLGAGLLALRAGGTAFGWGFQFQSPVFVAIMAWLILAVGLNFAGLFEVGGLQNLGAGLAARGGWIGSFATGLLAVIVATPCTAPFMGGAIAAALAAPPLIGWSIFAALGLGLALPFLIVGLIPAVASLLPRPGAWMDVLRQFLAFPMFATATWLLWVMALEAGATGVLIVGAGGVLLGLGLWLLRFRGLVPRGLAALAALALLSLLPRIDRAGAASPGAHRHALTLPGAVAYSASRLAALRQAGTPVFVDMTAAWCITCQVNERVALEPQAVRAAFRRHHVTVMVGDWTRRDAAITRYLAAHGRDGVPLYVYYPPDHRQPLILPQILTPSIVIGALSQR